MSVPRLKLEIVQGATFRKILYWYSGEEVVKSIASVTRGYPTIVATSAAHGLPASAVPVAIIGSGWLNTQSTDAGDRIYATKIDANSFSVKVDSTAKTAYTSGGHLIYTPPVDLTTWSAAMQLRASVGASVSLHALSSDEGTIVLGADGSIELVISADDTAAMSFASAVSQLELTSVADGEITRLFSIDWSLSPESTR